MTWTFAADPGLYLNLTILNFDAPNGTLSIGFGRYPSDSSTLLATLSDNVGGETQVSIPSNEAWIRLEAPLSGFGFYAELSTYLGGSCLYSDYQLMGEWEGRDGGVGAQAGPDEFKVFWTVKQVMYPRYASDMEEWPVCGRI